MRVLVTRPQPSATKTAERLHALGHEAIVLPLTRIDVLDPQWPAGRFDAVLATSAHAFAAASLLPEVWKSLPVHVVGSRTAQAARCAGFEKAGLVAPDGNSLLAGLSGSCARGSRLVYLCGKVRRPDLERGLEKRGHFVIAVETYDTIQVSYLTDKIAEIAGTMPIDACLVMSGETASGLAHVLRDVALGQLFDKTLFYCISGRIAEALEPLAPGRVRVSATADEDGLFRLIAGLEA